MVLTYGERCVFMAKATNAQRISPEKMILINEIVIAAVCIVFGGTSIFSGAVLLGSITVGLGILIPGGVYLLRNSSRSIRSPPSCRSHSRW